ncbi:MAG: DUF3021 domain-containing protein [Clostridia bacterium]|nr:DUF3021 domain-containing protein [Clostridia bacterium]
MKNLSYGKQFLLIGACFAGLGPIVGGMILWLILSPANLSLTGGQVFLAIVSTYIIAFVQAGSSVFHRIEHWSPLKAALAQLLSIYAVYTAAYLVNSWMPLKWEVVAIYTAIFVLVYAIIWIVVSVITKSVTKKLNKKITEQ